MEEYQISNLSSKQVIYKRRWWVLGAFSYNCITQTVIWNTWGPIAQSAKYVYDWDDATIGMIANYSNISTLFTVMFASYFMDHKGLRISAVLCSGLIFVAAALRCITSDPDYATWLMYLSAIINGLAGTVFFAGPALLASLWFPPDQRATATAVSSLCIYGGLAGGFLIGPQLVSSPDYNSTTDPVRSNPFTTPSVNVTHFDSERNDRNSTDLLNMTELRDQIMWLMYIECIAAGVGFLAILVYFPDKPPTAPSTSATVKRTEYRKAVCEIIRLGRLWQICTAFSLPIGVYAAWGAILDVILHPVGVTQWNELRSTWVIEFINTIICTLTYGDPEKGHTRVYSLGCKFIASITEDAGWIGFYSTIGGCIAGLMIARFADIFMRHMKLFLICLYTCGAVSFIWFTLVCENIISFSTAQLYISSIAGGIFLNGTIPLFYELSCETSYPIAEGITGAFSTILDSVFGVIFLLILQIPNIGTSWMNWFLVGSIAMGLLCLLTFRESYHRTDLDITIEIPKPEITYSKEQDDINIEDVDDYFEGKHFLDASIKNNI